MARYVDPQTAVTFTRRFPPTFQQLMAQDHDVPSEDYSWNGCIRKGTSIICVICNKSDCLTPVDRWQESHVIGYEASETEWLRGNN